MAGTGADMRVRIFLKQPFFTLPGYIPKGAVVLEGTLEAEKQIGWQVGVDGWFNDSGVRVEGAHQRLIIPTAKIDHALVLG